MAGANLVVLERRRWLIARSTGWIDETGGMGQACECEVSEPMTEWRGGRGFVQEENGP